MSVGQIMKPEGINHSREINSMFCGTTKLKEQIRQERIINAIIDNDASDWYNSTFGSQTNKRRTYSTFDGRTTLKLPESEKRLKPFEKYQNR